MLIDVPIEQLSAEEDIALFKTEERRYTISLVADQKLVGTAMVFKSGKILFPDTKTMASAQRTTSYLSSNDAKKQTDEIITYIEDLLN